MNFYGKGKKKKRERERDTSQIHNTESGSCTLTIVTNCKSTILQSSIGKRLKKRNGVPALLSTSLTWDAVPSLEAEQAGVPLPDWGGVDTAWHSALH